MFLKGASVGSPLLTAQQQPSEQLVVAGRGVAVPAVVAELVLALGQPVLGAGADGLHHPGVLAAQLPLLVDQAGDIVAHHLGAQRAHVPAERAGELLTSLFRREERKKKYILGSSLTAEVVLCFFFFL